MSNWKLIKLNFGSNPAHFGRLGIGMEETVERVQSDTLFSAWMSNFARLFGKDAIESLLQKFNESSPPVRMSSTFIYHQKKDDKNNSQNITTYYLPRPQKFPIRYPNKDLDFFKTYKKLSYLPLEVWQRWYQGDGITDEDIQELIEKTNTKKTNGKLDKAGVFDYSKAYQIDKHPKVAIDRTTRATNFYHTGFVQFQWEKSISGLYFLLKFTPEGEKIADKLKAALELLGEEGLGGERSSGAGRFEVEWSKLPESWDKAVKAKGTHHQLISLFWDSDVSQKFLENSAYEIIECGGWIGDMNLRRKMVRMFKEGSVFSQQPQGKLVDVTPIQFKKHRIYRSGIGLSLPIKIQQV